MQPKGKRVLEILRSVDAPAGEGAKMWSLFCFFVCKPIDKIFNW